MFLAQMAAGLEWALMPNVAPLRAAAPGKILLATPNVIPTCYMENDRLTGVLADLVVEAFRRAGQPIEILLHPWARCLEEARLGAIDGIFPIFRTPEREAFLVYCDEILMPQIQSFFVRKDSAFTFDGDLAKIAQARIGLQNKVSYGARFDRALHEGLFSNIDYANEPYILLKMLVGGRIDVILMHRDEAIANARRFGVLDDLREIAPPLDSVDAFVAFSRLRDHEEALNGFAASLRAMHGDGTYQAIKRKYFL